MCKTNRPIKITFAQEISIIKIMSEQKYIFFFLFLILLFANIVLRIQYFQEVQERPDILVPPHDAEFKEYWAQAIITGDWSPPRNQRNPFEIHNYPNFPGYPWFMAAHYFLFGINNTAIRVSQMILGILTFCLFFLTAYFIWGYIAALAVMLLLTIYWILPFTESVLDQAALVNFLAINIIITFSQYISNYGKTGMFRQKKRWRGPIWVALCAFCCLSLVCNRTESVPFIIALILWSGIIVANNLTIRQSIFRVCILSTIILPAFMFLAYPNVKALGSIFVGSENKLLFCNNPESSLTSDISPYLSELLDGQKWSHFTIPVFWENYAEKNNIDPKDRRKMAAQMREEVFGFIRENPGLTAKRVLQKAILSWTPEEIDENYVLAYEKEHSPILRYMAGFPLALAGFVFGLGAWLWHLFRDRKHWREKARVEIPVVLLILAYIGVFFRGISALSCERPLQNPHDPLHVDVWRLWR
jgi:4-amino-4-deoxy-L-arabinose transferase-like glycosyltransferase